MRITFLIWMLCYPLVTSAGEYVRAARRVRVEGKEPHPDTAHAITQLLEGMVWAFVAIQLWRAGA